MISGSFHFHQVSCYQIRSDERLQMECKIEANARLYEYGWHTMQGICVRVLN